MLPKTLKTKFLLYSCQMRLYLLCAHGVRFHGLPLKTHCWRVNIYLKLCIYVPVCTFKGSVMALLCAVHAAAWRTWRNLLKLSKAELPCPFSYKDSSLRVEAVMFCRAKTILGLKALACFPLLIFCHDPSIVFSLNRDEIRYPSRSKRKKYSLLLNH